jgi:hypothetical protein
MYSNQAGEITLFDDIVQLRITDGDADSIYFEQILELIQKVFRETDIPLRLILNSLDEDIGSDIVAQLVKFLDSSSLNTEKLIGTAVILSSVQCTFSKFLIDSLKLTKPVAVFSCESKAAEFITSL